MALEIDGFEVFHSIGSHRAAFAGIGSDLVKAARTLVVKLIKDKKTGLAALRDIRTALGAETFNLIADGMADSQIKSVAANLFTTARVHCNEGISSQCRTTGEALHNSYCFRAISVPLVLRENYEVFLVGCQ